MPQLISSNENVFLDYEMSVRIQNIYYNLLIQALQKHCKVFVLRMDVHIPQELVLQIISDFNHRFIEKEKIAGYDPLYIVAREISFGKRIHHHMALFLDGNKTNHPYQHFENARIVLRNYCGSYGEINECSDNLRNGIMIDRNSTTYNNLYEVLRQISYLAKKTQKDNVPGKTFFYSKVQIIPLGEEDITMYFQSLFPHLTFGPGTQWYSCPVYKAFLTW